MAGVHHSRYLKWQAAIWGNGMDHKFEVGSAVQLRPHPLNSDAVRDFKVIRHLPADADGVPAYRLENASGQERAARETDFED